MRRFGIIAFISVSLGLCSCESTSFRSSVPAYPVHVVIDTRLGAFVHFQPTALNSYVTVDREGYFLNGDYVLPTGVMDAWGYGGVLVFVSVSGYDAYDLACPYCASRGAGHSCTIDGMFATCPHCGEQYDLSSGTAAPQNGVAHETLKRLNIKNSDGKLTITQK